MFGRARKDSTSRLSITTPCDMGELRRLEDIEKRRLHLYGEILPVSFLASFSMDVSVCADIAHNILEFNEEDYGLPIEKRQPIWLFIDSPGGDPVAGFQVIDAIRLSKTPVITVNVGQCSSMAFLIAIAGHVRFSLPMSTFLMHDGSLMVYGTTNKVKDQVHFEDRLEAETIKPFILKYGKGMQEEEYDKIYLKEFYMMPEDALKYGFIDKIVDDIDIFMSELVITVEEK